MREERSCEAESSACGHDETERVQGKVLQPAHPYNRNRVPFCETGVSYSLAALQNLDWRQRGAASKGRNRVKTVPLLPFRVELRKLIAP